jgi:hypothetical protein
MILNLKLYTLMKYDWKIKYKKFSIFSLCARKTHVHRIRSPSAPPRHLGNWDAALATIIAPPTIVQLMPPEKKMAWTDLIRRRTHGRVWWSTVVECRCPTTSPVRGSLPSRLCLHWPRSANNPSLYCLSNQLLLLLDWSCLIQESPSPGNHVLPAVSYLSKNCLLLTFCHAHSSTTPPPILAFLYAALTHRASPSQWRSVVLPAALATTEAYKSFKQCEGCQCYVASDATINQI